ncbi:MAG: hypothetical protein HRS57_00275 [Mycoplasmataceae bacterium]|nr:hypothetical protein [Mycoplasmataceae bacterium]
MSKFIPKIILQITVFFVPVIFSSIAILNYDNTDSYDLYANDKASSYTNYEEDRTEYEKNWVKYINLNEPNLNKSGVTTKGEATKDGIAFDAVIAWDGGARYEWGAGHASDFTFKADFHDMPYLGDQAGKLIKGSEVSTNSNDKNSTSDGNLNNLDTGYMDQIFKSKGEINLSYAYDNSFKTTLVQSAVDTDEIHFKENHPTDILFDPGNSGIGNQAAVVDSQDKKDILDFSNYDSSNNQYVQGAGVNGYRINTSNVVTDPNVYYQFAVEIDTGSSDGTYYGPNLDVSFYDEESNSTTTFSILSSETSESDYKNFLHQDNLAIGFFTMSGETLANFDAFSVDYKQHNSRTSSGNNGSDTGRYIYLGITKIELPTIVIGDAANKEPYNAPKLYLKADEFDNFSHGTNTDFFEIYDKFTLISEPSTDKNGKTIHGTSYYGDIFINNTNITEYTDSNEYNYVMYTSSDDYTINIKAPGFDYKDWTYEYYWLNYDKPTDLLGNQWHTIKNINYSVTVSAIKPATGSVKTSHYDRNYVSQYSMDSELNTEEFIAKTPSGKFIEVYFLDNQVELSWKKEEISEMSMKYIKWNNIDKQWDPNGLVNETILQNTIDKESKTLEEYGFYQIETTNNAKTRTTYTYVVIAPNEPGYYGKKGYDKDMPEFEIDYIDGSSEVLTDLGWLVDYFVYTEEGQRYEQISEQKGFEYYEIKEDYTYDEIDMLTRQLDSYHNLNSIDMSNINEYITNELINEYSTSGIYGTKTSKVEDDITRLILEYLNNNSSYDIYNEQDIEISYEWSNPNENNLREIKKGMHLDISIVPTVDGNWYNSATFDNDRATNNTGEIKISYEFDWIESKYENADNTTTIIILSSLFGGIFIAGGGWLSYRYVFMGHSASSRSKLNDANKNVKKLKKEKKELSLKVSANDKKKQKKEFKEYKKAEKQRIKDKEKF